MQLQCLHFLLPGTNVFKQNKNIPLKTVSSWEKFTLQKLSNSFKMYLYCKAWLVPGHTAMQLCLFLILTETSSALPTWASANWTGLGVLTPRCPAQGQELEVGIPPGWKSSAGAGGLLAPPSDACGLAQLLLPAWSTRASWLRVPVISGGKKGKLTLKTQILRQELAFSPQHHHLNWLFLWHTT